MKTIQSLRKSRLIQCYEGIVTTIGNLGYDIENDNFRETPERCARAMLDDFILPKALVMAEIAKMIEKTFPTTADEMVVETSIPVISLCPHHLLPIEMSVSIGYIPSDRVLGLSKLVRIAQLFGKQPILQEQYTADLANTFRLLKPSGIGVYVVGKHGCMRFRGVKVPETDTITSSLIGNFKSQPATREEFLRLCRGK